MQMQMQMQMQQTFVPAVGLLSTMMDLCTAGDLHALDVKTMRWDQPRTSGKPPGPRAWHSATLALAPHSADYLLIFGGACRGTGGAMHCLNDLYVLAAQLA